MNHSDTARTATPRPVQEIAAELGIPEAALVPFGRHKAKVDLDFLARLGQRPPGRLVLVSAMHPTPAGEGKTTITIGLGDALNRLGRRATVCLREPSLGPCFGRKGGATGGGRAQVIPREDINLHFTGDFHAVGSAHNLLAALVDNRLHFGDGAGLDPRSVTLRRVLDMNDRALRQIVSGLGGNAHGVPRETGFDITPASEVMAVLGLAGSREDLRERLARIVVGHDRQGRPLTAGDLQADGAMAVLLREALAPNLVQTMAGTPALIHGGPFANIAHGTSTVLAARAAQALSEYSLIEAGFGSDLGAEKFFNIVSRQSGLDPDGVVLVASLRALKWQGGAPADRLERPDAAAVEAGFANLRRHVANLGRFGPPVVVALNRFAGDSEAETDTVRGRCRELGVPFSVWRGWDEGPEGGQELAEAVAEMIGHRHGRPRFSYADDEPLWDKAGHIAREVYGAEALEPVGRVRERIEALERQGFGGLQVCMAKTEKSFSADPALRGAPEGFRLPVRDARVAAGAGFVVMLAGEMMTMPGLPRHPAAEAMDLAPDGTVRGLR